MRMISAKHAEFTKIWKDVSEELKRLNGIQMDTNVRQNVQLMCEMIAWRVYIKMRLQRN